MSLGFVHWALLYLALLGFPTFGYLVRSKMPRVAKFQLHSGGKGFGQSGPAKPTSKVITPAMGVTNHLEKFLMMYTCKPCSGRNAQMVSKLAYQSGMVISTCRHCGQRHFIADNEQKLDFKGVGLRIDSYLEEKGQKVQRYTVSAADLEEHYLVDRDGVLSLYPRKEWEGGLPDDASLVDFHAPTPPQTST